MNKMPTRCELKKDSMISLQEWQVEAIKEGMAAAERGDLAGHDAALAVLERWGRRQNAALME